MADSEREVGMENAQALLDFVESYRSFVERGDKSKAVYLVEFCLKFGLPIPAWLESDVRAAMRFYLEKGGAEKQGSKGNLAQTRTTQIDVARYMSVERERALGATKPLAIKNASKKLRGTFARGSEGQIETSYDRIARLYRDSRRKPGPKPKG